MGGVWRGDFAATPHPLFLQMLSSYRFSFNYDNYNLNYPNSQVALVIQIITPRSDDHLDDNQLLLTELGLLDITC